MAVTLGSEGLEQVSMIIPQYTSFPASFLINDEDGHAVDLTGWTARARIQSKKVNCVLDTFLTIGENGIEMLIPGSTTATLPKGTHYWDLMVEDINGVITRLCYGTAKIVDTYAYDEVNEEEG